MKMQTSTLMHKLLFLLACLGLTGQAHAQWNVLSLPVSPNPQYPSQCIMVHFYSKDTISLNVTFGSPLITKYFFIHNGGQSWLEANTSNKTGGTYKYLKYVVKNSVIMTRRHITRDNGETWDTLTSDVLTKNPIQYHSWTDFSQLGTHLNMDSTVYFAYDPKAGTASSRPHLYRSRTLGRDSVRIFDSLKSITSQGSPYFALNKDTLWAFKNNCGTGAPGRCSYGLLHRSTNGGTTWELIPTPIMFDTVTNSLGERKFTSFYFVSLDTGFLTVRTNHAEGKSNLYRTVDGGRNWQLIHQTSGKLVHNMLYFKNSMIGFGYGNDDGIYKTVDGAFTWHKQLNTFSYLVHFTYENGVYYAFDLNHNVYYTSTEGDDVQVGTEELSTLLALHLRVYPNPTESQTITLAWDMPLSDTYQVQVFDLLGKRIPYTLTKLQSDKQATLQLDASAGVYIIQLSDGEYKGNTKVIVK